MLVHPRPSYGEPVQQGRLNLWITNAFLEKNKRIVFVILLHYTSVCVFFYLHLASFGCTICVLVVVFVHNFLFMSKYEVPNISFVNITLLRATVASEGMG